MTLTANPPQADAPRRRPKGPGRRRFAAIATAVVLAAGGGIGIGLAASGGSPTIPTGPVAAASYAYYQSMMGSYGGEWGSMMGGHGGPSMMGQSGYAWMLGGAAAPGWMTGGTLHGFMMGTNTDPGEVMGSLLANAPGPRVSAAEATRLGDQVPARSTVDRSADRITFTTTIVKLAVVASSPGGPDETFRVAGMVNPTIVVPQGAQVSIEVVNADPDTAHGLVITGSSSASSPMPMMTSAPAFAGSALWFLGNPTPVGMHTGSFTFAAATSGAYQYLCPVPGHAQKGMVGTFIVS